MKHLIIITLLASSLVACGGGSSSSQTEPVVEPEAVETVEAELFEVTEVTEEESLTLEEMISIEEMAERKVCQHWLESASFYDLALDLRNKLDKNFEEFPIEPYSKRDDYYQELLVTLSEGATYDESYYFCIMVWEASDSENLVEQIEGYYE